MIELAQLPVFPCNLAKKPLTAHSFKSAKRRANPKGWPLIGFATGAVSGVDVLDIDPRAHSWYDQNFDALPQTRAHSTQRGLHLLFKHAPGLRCSTDKIADGLDVRADGGYAIYWPATGLPVEDAPLAEWPDWLLAEALGRRRPLLQGPCSLVGAHHHHHDGGDRGGGTLNPTKRTNALQRKVEYAQRGNRNAMLNWAAFQFGRMIAEGVMRRDIAERLLRSCAAINGLWREDGAAQCMATIKSGLDAGMAQARRDEAGNSEHGPYKSGCVRDDRNPNDDDEA
jgi:hypothetical protein